MDIRRIPLWEGRNATIISNDVLRAVIEDMGDVMLELSAVSARGGRVNALSIPYFRGIGAGVESDPNSDWYKGRERSYNAGGSYLTFPSKEEGPISSYSQSWIVRRYGSENERGGIWRMSEMKSREEHNRYKLTKIDLMLPDEAVIYSLVRIDNLMEDEDLMGEISMHSMLSPPFLEQGCIISSSDASFVSFPPNLRVVATNSLRSGYYFSDLRKVPSSRSGTVDASVVPGPSGTYDYVMGELKESTSLGWVSVNSPRSQLMHCLFFLGPASNLPEECLRLSKIDFAMNYSGRMESPWALYEGGTPQVFSLTVGAGVMAHGGAFGSPERISIPPSESRMMLYGQALAHYQNPRMGLGFYSCDVSDDSIVFKRTKSFMRIGADTGFSSIMKLGKRVMSESVNPT